MPKNKKKFIDKKNAVTFHLVHRSQQDPLVTDTNAPQHVLKDVTQKDTKQREEHRKYGIYFDDDYDYLQHLRPRDNSFVWEQSSQPTIQESKIQLPSSVFASEVEEDVGLLNRAPPQSGLQLHLDPDIVAGMDEDFDYSDPENELEDNFVELANGIKNDDEFENEMYSDEESLYTDEYVNSDEGEKDYCSSENDDIGSLKNFNKEETKSRFTDYSMSSSVIRRNKQLMLLDDRFEQMMSGYDDLEIGALDCDEIEGDIDPSSDYLLKLAEEMDKDKPQKLDTEGNCLVNLNMEQSDDEKDEEIFVPVKEKEQWDCETVISTYSNLYNHPKLIVEPRINKIKVDRKTGIPLNGTKLTAKNLATLGGQDSKGPGSIISMISTLSLRNKDETLEEKRSRKTALKLYRRERRAERKLNTEAFKEEKKIMEKALRNSKVCSQAVHY